MSIANMDILNVQTPRRILLNANQLQQNENLTCDSSRNDDYRSVSSFDSPISDRSSTSSSYTLKSVDGTIKKTLIVHGTVLAANSITIKTFIELSKIDEKNEICSAKIECPNGKRANVCSLSESLNDVDDVLKKPKQTYQMDGNQNVTSDSNWNSNELCVEKQMKEIKRLFDFITKIIKLNKSNVPSQVERLRQKIDEFKKQMDTIKMKNGSKSKSESSAYLIESKRERPHRSSSNRKISEKSPTTSKSIQKIPDAEMSAKIPQEIDEVEKFHTYKNPVFHLNLSSGRSANKKKQVLSPIPNRCNKCNPLKNSNCCVPYAEMPYNRNSKRKTFICFCYCAYTKGTDGVTYHTLCQCCGPPTNSIDSQLTSNIYF